MSEAYYSVNAPVFKIESERRGELTRDLIRLDVEEATDGLKTLSAHFVAIGPGKSALVEELLYLDGAILDFGKLIEVSIGPPGGDRPIFKGLISAIEATFEEAPAPQVAVFAEDSLMKLRMTPRTRTYENVSDADIAEAIASEHGLSADTSADGPTYDLVQQLNMSDLAFLRERAELTRAEIWLQDDTLHFKTRPNRSAESITLVQGNHLLSVQIRADLAHQRSKVRVTGYDAEERDVIDEEAGGDAIQAEISGGLTGPSILERAFGERVAHRARRCPLTGTEASAWARAEMLRRSRSFVTAVGITRGTPDMVVGSRLNLERVGAPFSGDGYYVTRVRHSYDPSNHQAHRTHFEAERPTVNEATS